MCMKAHIQFINTVYTWGLIAPMCMKAQSLSCVQLLVTLWTGAHQAPLFMEFSR